MINIAGLTPVEDPSYRYKMPKIAGKVEGRGNGIKTLLVNVREVAMALNREATEVTKFFGTELGAQTTFEAETDRAIVNGAHSDVLLLEKMRTYIEKFVLCGNCKLPETHYKIKDSIITQRCLACGAKTVCDMGHKLTTFILAQHKKAKADAKKAGGDADKKDKKDKKKDKEKDKPDGTAAGGGDGDGKSSPREKSAKKDKEGAEDGVEKKKSKSKEKKTFFDGEPGQEAEDEEESDSKATDEAIVRFRAWTLDNASCTPEQSAEELRLIQIQHSLRPADRAIIFVGAVFTEAAAATATQVTTHKAALALLAPSAIQQRHLIAAFEWLCGAKYPSLQRFFPLFLKQLFDEEVVEEDVFFNWATDYARNEYSASDSLIHIDVLEALKASAAPFITWLQEAEEEGEEGEDEDDEEEEEDDE